MTTIQVSKRRHKRKGLPVRELSALPGWQLPDPRLRLRKFRAWLGNERGALTWVWLLRVGGLILLAGWVVVKWNELPLVFYGMWALIALFIFQIGTAIGGFYQPEVWHYQRNKTYQNLIEVLLLSIALVHLGPVHGIGWSLYLIPIFSAFRFLQHHYRWISIGLTLSAAAVTGLLVYNAVIGLFIPLTINGIGLAVLLVSRRTAVNPDALSDEQSELTRILNNHSSGICVIDRERRLRFVNAELRRQFGPWTPTMKCYQYLGCIDENCTGCLLPAGESFHIFRQTMIDRNGRKHIFEVKAQPLSEEGDALMFLKHPQALKIDLYERLLAAIVDSNEDTFDDALRQLLDSIREQFQAEAAAIFWLNNGRLERTVESGPPLHFPESYLPGEGVTGLTLLPEGRGSVVRVNNLDEHKAVRREYVQAYQQALPSGNVRHLLAVPLMGQQRIIGVLRLVNLLTPAGLLADHGFHSAHDLDLQIIAERLARALEYRELHLKIKRQLEETKRFYRIYAESAYGRNVFEAIVEEGLQAFPEASKCEIRQFDRPSQRLRFIEARHRRGFDHKSPPGAIEGISGRALRENRIQFVEDTGRDPDFIPREVPIGAMIVAPLAGHLGLTGILTLDYPHPRIFTPDEQERFKALATHAELAAASFWREQQAEQLREHIQRISEPIGNGLEGVYQNVFAALRKLIGYDSASIQLLYGDHLQIVACDGFADPEAVRALSFDTRDERLPNYRVMQQREPLIVADALKEYPHFQREADRYHTSRINSILYTPLVYRGKTIGMIALDSYTPNFYRAGDGVISTLITNAAASAIEHARLVQALQDQRMKLADLLKHSVQLIGITDMSRLLRSYVQLGERLFDCEHCAIFIWNPRSEQIEAAVSSLNEYEQLIGESPYVELARYIAGIDGCLHLTGEDLTAFYERFGLAGDNLSYMPTGRGRSLLACPISFQHQSMIGVVLLENSCHRDSEDFPETAIELLALFGQQLAFGLDVVTMRQQVRYQLGIEVHDLRNFLQGAIILRSRALIRQLEREVSLEMIKTKLNEINRAAQTIYHDLRNIQEDLRGKTGLEQPFGESLKNYIDLIQEWIGQRVTIHQNIPELLDLLPDKAYQLFRICQEALTNIAKHAGLAERSDGAIWITVRATPDTFALEIEDNGKGFDRSAICDESYGLKSIKQRVNAIGAQAAIEPRDGGGVVVRVTGSTRQE